MKKMPSDHFVKVTPRRRSLFNFRLNVSGKYDTLPMQTNLKFVLHCMKNMKSPLNA